MNAFHCRVRAYGPGIKPVGLIVGIPANFTIETFSAGRGSIYVEIMDSKEHLVNTEIIFNNDKKLTYSVMFLPILEGNYKVVVKYAGHNIPKSPFIVNIKNPIGDSSMVKVDGRGINSSPIFINKTYFFDIITKDAGSGIPEVVVTDPANHKESVQVKLKEVEKDIWRCEYVASLIGSHSINVLYGGSAIPKSPFAVEVLPKYDIRKIRAVGRGLQETGIRVKDNADFKVFIEGARKGILEVNVIGPGGTSQKVLLSRIDSTTYEAHYYPMKEGRYVVTVSFDGQEIPKSPFEVQVGPYKDSSIIAYGPGLRGGVEGCQASFIVETNGETGALGFTISGPSQAEIECHDNGDGSALVKYFPTASGEYAVHILCDNADIPKSPHIAHILAKSDFNPQKVKSEGLGIKRYGNFINKPTKFKVDVSEAGLASLEVVVQDVFGDQLPVHIKDSTNPNTKVVTYTPRSPHPHCVEGIYHYLKYQLS